MNGTRPPVEVKGKSNCFRADDDGLQRMVWQNGGLSESAVFLAL